MKKIQVDNRKTRFKQRTIFLGIFLAVIGIGLFLFFNYGLTGNVSLNVETNYDPNSTLDGKMSLSLKPGELIPKDSVITISMENKSYDFVLSDLVTLESAEGDFYAEGLTLTGSGEGYGIKGTKKISKEVDFVMKVSSGSSNLDSDSDSDSDSGSDSDSTEETAEESEDEIADETTEDVEEEATEETPEETVTITGEVEEETTEEAEEETTEETETVTEEAEEETSPGNSGNSNAGGNSGNANENSNAGGNSGTSVLTGEVIANIEEEISGSVSSDSEYTYELDPGQTASIVSSTEDVTLSVENNIVTVTTNSQETDAGFGIEYLGENYDYKIEIDLTVLELEVEEGKLTVRVDYESIKIVEVSTQLSIDDPNQVSIFNTVLPLESEDISDYALSTEQIFALKGKTGVETAEITKAEERGDFIIIRFVAGKYWLENSYDKTLDEDDLRYQIELDRAKFMNRLAQSFLQAEESAVEIEGYLGTTSLINVTSVDDVEVVEDESSEETTEEVVEEDSNTTEETVEEPVNTTEEIIEESSNETVEEEDTQEAQNSSA